MTQPDPTGFGKFVPGFEFLQSLAKGGNASMAGWVAPTLDARSLDKRIDELKAVQFWLDQNAAGLKATIQALEVQKMTLATLESMNVSLNKAAGMPWGTAAKPAATPSAKGATVSNEHADKPAGAAGAAPQGGAMPDPVQYWGALTRQFQQIAADAMKDMATRHAAAPPAAKAPDAKPAKPRAARKPPVRKTAS